MKHLFIGGHYDGQRLDVTPGIEQIVYEVTPEDVGLARRFIYTRRTLIIDAKRVHVFVLDGLAHENILPRYLKLTKGKTWMTT